ncbi:MAG: hypothetical protein RJA07_1184 [Bacteroidota bacterium]|jgi:asparagine synthase (glutamine-hydrolysing)
MCGIAGIYNLNRQRIDVEKIQQMIAVQTHRGPDGSGVWLNEEETVGLGHNRLSIIDLSANAAQPMHYAGLYSITYNGELYNYKQLREELKGKGHQFKTASDTEVLLALYAEYAVKCLQKMDGMFAFAIWDKKQNILFCARDRFGEKPFHYYYSKQEGKFIFASEIKTIYASKEVEKKINHKMVYNYLAHELVENPFDLTETFFENIFRLASASYMIINSDGDLKINKYWQLRAGLNVTHQNIVEQDVYHQFKEQLTNSVKSKLQADVPVGTSLSGGLDSSTIVCIMNQIKETNQVQKTFSARFYDDTLDEGKYINMVRNDCQIEPHDAWIDEENLIEKAVKILHFQDEPYAGTSVIAQWEVMKLAAENNVKVLLDGQGADEYLAGYTNFITAYYKQLFVIGDKKFQDELDGYMDVAGHQFNIDFKFMMEARFPKMCIKVRELKRKYIGVGYNDFLNNEYVNANEPASIESPFKYFDNLSESLQYSTTEYGLHKLLKYADRNSMANSIEVRLPFLQHQMVENVLQLPNEFLINSGWTKYLLRRSFADIVPSEITWRKNKLSFQPPEKKWMNSHAIEPIMNEAHEWLHNNGITNKYAKEEMEWKYLMVYLFLNQ